MSDPVWPIQSVRWFSLSDRGRIRRNNEDSFLGLQFNAQEIYHLGKIGEALPGAMDFVFAVSDGMGGANAGEFASRIAVEKITRRLPPAFKQKATGVDAGFSDVLTELFAEIHKALTYLAWGDPDCAGMGATLTLGWLTPGWFYFAHIGDSRIYYLPKREGGIKQLSHDDTYVGWLFRQGRMNEREARQHPGKNALQRALGAGHQFVEPQVGAVGYEPGDQFLLCTDGLVDGLFDYQILERLRDPAYEEGEPNPARRLVNAALERSGRDNTTALLVELV
ncbi:MAG TPA: protein phosphatase 2C domain-containing protein [Chthoniobacterales bacterium]